MCKCTQENSDKCILHCEKDDWYENGILVNISGNIIFMDELKKLLYHTLKMEEDRKKELENNKDFYIQDSFDFVCEKYIFPEIDFGYFDEYKKVSLYFKECKFLGKTKFSYKWDNRIVLENCYVKNLDFSFAKINNKVKMQFCNIDIANFYNTSFNELVDLYQSEFKQVNFERTNFKEVAVFSEVKFDCNLYFKYTKFLDKSIFRDATIFGQLNLKDAIFKDKMDFLNIKLEKGVENRETARIIKDSFEQQNNIIEANKFYALEMKEREKELSPKKDFFEWLVFKIHGLVSNHSQDWVLVLFWIISLTFISSFIKIIDCNISQIIEKIVLSFIVTAIVLFISINISNTKKIYYIICSLVYYILYSIFTKDFALNIFSNTINPFSIMTGKEELTFGILLYKITIAYLIYQLIVSIRQNTRRK